MNFEVVAFSLFISLNILHLFKKRQAIKIKNGRITFANREFVKFLDNRQNNIVEKKQMTEKNIIII